MIRAEPPTRSYLPAEFDPSDVQAADERFGELLRRDLPDLAALKAWVGDMDELHNALEEERNQRLVASTQHTEDEALQAAYRTFLETVTPLMMERRKELDDKLLQCAFTKELDPGTFGEFLDSVATRRRLYRAENVPLDVEENSLRTEFGRLMGATMVSFEGAEHTLPRMRIYGRDPDRARREAGWRATSARLLQDRLAYDELLDKLIDVRTRMARNAGFQDYVEYRHAEWRRCYTPEDTQAFHEAIESRVLPVRRALQARRREELGVDALRPWDVAVDPHGRPALQPFDGGCELVALSRRLFERVDPLFSEHIGYMAERDLLDLDSRPGKGPGGYMCGFAEQRLPFIFMNASGLQIDVITMLHEGGHAFHFFEARDLDPSFNRSAPMEFCEVASMAMEFMALEGAAEVYAPEDGRRAWSEQLERCVQTMAWVATIDSFQQELYRNPEHSHDERTEMWLRAFRRFGGDIDFGGLERQEATRWQQQGHIFSHPLYYIEYALALLGALQIWRNFRRDRTAAVASYRNGLALGGRRPVPELFRAAGAEFDMGEGLLGDLMDMVSAEMARVA